MNSLFKLKSLHYEGPPPPSEKEEYDILKDRIGFESSEDIWSQYFNDEIVETKKERDAYTCPLCGLEDVLLYDEVCTCTACGEIVEKMFDTSAEYRFFATDDRGDDPCRVGAPQDHRLPEASLGTVILSGRGNGRTMNRVRKYHTWNAMPYKERSLLNTFERLNIASTNYGIGGSIIDDVKELFVSLYDLCDRRVLSRDAILASCLFNALKQAGTPRKPKEIADIFGLSTPTFTRALKYFQETFSLAEQKGLLKKQTVDLEQGSTKASEYIQLPLSKMELSRTIMDIIRGGSQDIADVAEENGYSIENMPPSLAAGCLAYTIQYYSKKTGQKQSLVSMAEIARVSQVSVATIQKCIKRLEIYKDELNGILDKYMK
jgi:transcription initiation factor TFIIIB Brf1 subunit/transcription initiation factor TFIIB